MPTDGKNSEETSEAVTSSSATSATHSSVHQYTEKAGTYLYLVTFACMIMLVVAFVIGAFSV